MHRRKGHTEREDDGWVVSVMVWKKGAGVALFALFALVCWFVGLLVGCSTRLLIPLMKKNVREFVCRRLVAWSLACFARQLLSASWKAKHFVCWFRFFFFFFFFFGWLLLMDGCHLWNVSFLRNLAFVSKGERRALLGFLKANGSDWPF